MGFFDIFGGLFSGERGAAYQAPQTVTPEQAQEAIRQQQQILNQQRAFTTMLGAQTPAALESQRLLQEQLRQQMAGQGPSVAQRQLAEATGQNVSQLSSLLAGQRGAGANVGLMGRQIGQLGGQAQQQAAGQAATLRAQEQLAAQGRLGELAGAQIGQVSTAQQAGLQAGQAQQNAMLNAINQQNAINQAIAAGNQQFQQQLVGGLLGGASGGMKFGARGGEVPAADEENEHDYWDYINEGLNRSFAPKKPTPAYQAGQNIGQMIGKKISGLFTPGTRGQTAGGYAGANLGVSSTMPTMVNPMASPSAIAAMPIPLGKGGKVPAMLSPGERYLPPSEVKKVADGKKEPVKAGKKVPGQAKVKGDSLENDVVPANLEPGGIVIPRSVMTSKNPEEKAREFVAAILARQSQKRKK